MMKEKDTTNDFTFIAIFIMFIYRYTAVEQVDVLNSTSM